MLFVKNKGGITFNGQNPLHVTKVVCPQSLIRSVQVKSIKDWNNIIDKIHFTTEDFMKRSEVIKKIKNALL